MIGREGIAAPRSPSNHTEAPSLSTSLTSVLSAPARATSSPATIAGLFAAASSFAIAAMPAGSGRLASNRVAGLAGGDVGLLLHHVDRQGHEHRTGRRLVGDLEGALQDRAELVGALDLHAPLGDGRRDRREVVAEHGIAQPHARVLLARRHHHRRVVLERAVDHADRVAEARRHMQVHEGRLAARLGVEVGRADRDALMQVHDVLQARIVEQRIEQRALGRAGIAEDALDAVIDEGLHQDLATAHGIFSRALALLLNQGTTRAGFLPIQMGGGASYATEGS